MTNTQCQVCFVNDADAIDGYTDPVTGKHYNQERPICFDCLYGPEEPSTTPASDAVMQYVIEQIDGGFTADVFQKYQVNAAQVTKVANLICWIARTEGSIKATVDGVTAHAIGDPMLGLMAYSVHGKDCAVYEWLDAIGAILHARFESEF